MKVDRFRIPDVCLIQDNAPYEKVIRTAPALCIEILFDPAARAGWIATPGHLIEATDGVLRTEGIEMVLHEISNSLNSVHNYFRQ